MSKFFKISLVILSAFFTVSSVFAQSTIEEVIVTAQRTEQSLQDVPIAVSAFTDEMITERQIEVASDIQLQVPGVAYSANTFGGGGFAIRGIANFATAASADAGVEVHVNGLPLGGATSTNEIGYMDMARIEVLRGPQGTLFGRNSTGGVINLITARPDLDGFSGRAKLQYGKNNEQQIDMMLNIPLNDEMGLRLAFNNFEKDGVNKNLYSKLVGTPFDNRDSYQWRATFLWEPTDDLTITLLHNAFDEESSRTQQDGTWCQTGGNLVQGCVMGGKQVFEAIHPMSNGSTLPGLLGGTLSFYVPSNLTNGSANEGKLYAPTGLPQDTGTVPQDFFQSNVWAAPRHDVQESMSQFSIEKDFDNGQLTVAYNDIQRQFYRDTTSFSEEASGLRWSAKVQDSVVYADSSDPNGPGLPLGYSNSIIAPDCVVEQYKSGIFCPGGAGVRGNHILPVSGDAFHQKINSKTTEIKYVSDLDGMFNFLIGAIDISNNTHSYYDVYASGITLNALMLPSSIASGTRTALRGAVACGALSAPAGPCTQVAIDSGKKLLAASAPGAAAITAAIADAGGTGVVTAANYAQDAISRVDGLYTEHFHNITDSYQLDSKALFTEFYFDLADRHRLTAGLRYNEDRKAVSVNATFYKVPVFSNWSSTAAGPGGIGGTCGFNLSTGVSGSFDGTDENAACFTSGLDSKGVNTIGQQIGMVPGSGASNGSLPLGVLPENNADYTSFGVDPVKNFSETTGRLVWDFQINDDTLFYASYAKGFKGGGFNPPFNAQQFPDTPFAFESTEVDSIEFGVKASVPEVGLIANASVYYNDFKNFHIGVIRNETAINTGMPLENMGAELELYLSPPSVPGLTFNMMMSYATSEIGNFKMINPHDLGGHYRKQASTGNMDGYTDWHVAKNFTANSFLVNKDALGVLYSRMLDVQVGGAGANATGVATYYVQKGITKGSNADSPGHQAAAAAAGAYAEGQFVSSIRTANEIAFALTCTAATDCDGGQALTAADMAANVLPLEMSSAAVGYGNLGGACHFIPGAINTCLPESLGGTTGLAPTASQVYAPTGTTTATGIAASAPTVLANDAGTLLPSIINRGTGTSLQTGGVCKMFLAMTDHADNVTATNELSLAANERCASTVEGGVSIKGKWLSGGLEQDLSGNEMPYPELTMSMGLAYTFQTSNVEVTPRVDYYYQSDAYSSVFNIESQKIKAWDEINFSLVIVPTNADWNVRFWAQNLTDDRNVTGSGVGNSSVGHTTSVFVREGRSFGMSFGIDF